MVKYIKRNNFADNTDDSYFLQVHHACIFERMKLIIWNKKNIYTCDKNVRSLQFVSWSSPW
jgi:hypothetical protein